MNEAAARIKINRLLERAGWRFFSEEGRSANIRLGPDVVLKPSDLDGLGADFEQTRRRFVDYLLLDERGFPFIVLEAKSEAKQPLVGKEQARRYARAQNCRFVILSNGNLHYLWDLERGNPYIVTSLPTPESVRATAQSNPIQIGWWMSGSEMITSSSPNGPNMPPRRRGRMRPSVLALSQAHSLRFLRDYQLRAVHALQRAVQEGHDRFLFEMAHGHRQNPCRRGHRETVPALRQRLPCAVPGGSARTGRAGPESLHRPAFRGLPDGGLQRAARRLACRGDRCHHGPVAAVQQTSIRHCSRRRISTL